MDPVSSTAGLYVAAPTQMGQNVQQPSLASALVGAPNEPRLTAGAPRKGGVSTANSFKKPEEIVASIEVIAEYKVKLRPDKTFVLAIMAGIFVGFGVLVAATMGFGAPNVDPGLAKFVYACMFPTALLFVIILGAELVTSNFSTMTLGMMAQRVPMWKALRNVLLSYAGNLCGSLFVAAVFIESTGLMDGNPWNANFIAAALKKVHLTWMQAFVRGVGCNFLVVCAVWMCQAAEDITGKVLCAWFPIAMFAIIGFEHCVANMTFIPAAMMLGAPITVGDFIVHNLIPVTIGNIVGALLLTVPYYYVYWLPNHPIDFKACDFGLSHCMRRPEGEDELRKPPVPAALPEISSPKPVVSPRPVATAGTAYVAGLELRETPAVAPSRAAAAV